MTWSRLPIRAKVYLLTVYLLAIPISYLCFRETEGISLYWLAFVIASFLVASINLSLPGLPSILVSMGDVFTVFVLLHAGPGPALVTYWANVIASAVISYFKSHGRRFLTNIVPHRLFFNLATCSLSIYTMGATYQFFLNTLAHKPYAVAVALMSAAFVWFWVNTGTLSLAVSLSSATSLSTFAVWRKGLGIYLINFFGSCAAAGLLSILYKTDFSVFLLSIPLAAVLYQLHSYYVQKDQQAQKHINDLNKLYLQTIEALAAAVDAKDRYTHGHIRRVQAYAIELARCMGVTSDLDIMAIEAGALLHDIGKIAIPEYILNKPSALTDSEYGKMKHHPAVGSNMLKNIDFPYPVVPIVRSHHERWDGNGYPDGLKAEQIPVGARILALVDCYDALTTNRPYRAPMQRSELIGFFQNESGKAYDPAVVRALLDNLERIELAGTNVAEDVDVWGMSEVTSTPTVLRPLEKAQPIVTYGKALAGDKALQSHLFSVFEFAGANIKCLNTRDVFAFMGRKLAELVPFDAAVFYMADLEKAIVTAEHVVGPEPAGLSNLALPLEKKLSGWVASNNQSLCNLPPFPDFIGCSGEKPSFEISAMAPMNKNGIVWGTVSLYRKQKMKFTEEEFRRLEIIASQTAVALSNCQGDQGTGPLRDASTDLPSGYHLHLMFDQLVSDAQKFDYSFAFLAFQIDDARLRRRWGYAFGEEAIRTAADFLRKEFRETDLLVRYATNQFVAIVPRVDRTHADGLRTRLQGELGRLRVPVRTGANISLPIAIGVAVFPEDGLDLETLLGVSSWQAGAGAKLQLAETKAF